MSIKLVELIADEVATEVADPLIETAAEGLKGILRGVEGLVASTPTD